MMRREYSTNTETKTGTYPLAVSVDGAAVATSVGVVVVVVVALVVAVHARVVHVHHLVVHVVPVVHAVHGHGSHGAQRGPAQEAGRHPQAESLARVALAVAPRPPGKVGAPAGPVARSPVAVGLPAVRVDAAHGGAGVA